MRLGRSSEFDHHDHDGLVLFLAGWAMVALLIALVLAVQWRTHDAGAVDFTLGGGTRIIGAELCSAGERRSVVADSGRDHSRRLSFQLATYLLLNRAIGNSEDDAVNDCARPGANTPNSSFWLLSGAGAINFIFGHA